MSVGVEVGGARDAATERLLRLTARALGVPACCLATAECPHPLGDALLRLVAERGALLIDDVRAHPLASRSALPANGAVALAAAAVGGGGAVLYATAPAPRAWSAEDEEVLRDAAAAVAIIPRGRADDEPRGTDRTLRALIQASPLAIITTDVGGAVTTWNAAAERMLGWEADEVLGGEPPLFPEARRGELRGLHGGEGVTGYETRCVRRDGSELDVSISTAPIREAGGAPRGWMTVLADITERKQLEHQLHLSQKMEAVGQLAGGIAHDFNNLLTAIKCSSDLLLDRLPAGDEGHDEVLEIGDAADRAAALTRQLLAFSRRQVLQPVLLDLNAVVAGMGRILRRVIGEDVELATALQPSLGAVRADPGQLEQVLMNLAVNARDAMPRGGRLLIETADVELDQDYADRHAVVAPGRYVRLAVSDSGVGMDRETQERIFEPFFTTKAPGHGTGLGLSTAYGIIKQSGGFIWVYSEPGRGTTFKIYLPRVADAAPPAPRPAAPPPATLRGTETVLLVEDEDTLRSLMRRILEKQGYAVLEAPNGTEALRLAAAHAGAIDLLVTDVVMPEMGGKELAERLAERRPGTRVLFISGYTGVDIVRRGLVREDAAFLQKPLTPASLARKVREMLDA